MNDLRPPGWSVRCDPERRCLLLDLEVCQLVVAGEIESRIAKQLYEVNRALCGSRDGWDRARALHRACASSATESVLVTLGLYCRFGEAQLRSLPVAFALGVRPVECLALGVHGHNAEGEDLTLLDADAIRCRVETVLELEQQGRTSWLDKYASRLLREVQRRRGRAQR